MSEARTASCSSDQDLLGPPALLKDEDPDVFEELSARISAMLKPADILEQIWVRDFVYFVWEQQRLRRIKVSLLDPDNIIFKLKHIDRVDQMCLRAGLRRDAILREIERYRNSRLVQLQAKIENAEFVEVTAAEETR